MFTEWSHALSHFGTMKRVPGAGNHATHWRFDNKSKYVFRRYRSAATELN